MIRRLAPLLLLALAACADVTRPAPPPVIPRTVVTADPADARCRAIGAAARQDARVTPLELDTLALGLPIAVACERAGYLPTVETIHPRPALPLVLALARGALLSPMASDEAPVGVPPDSPVPASLTVRLRPVLFTTPTGRDRYFERLRTERQARWQALADRVESECAPRPSAPPTAVGPTPAACRAGRDALAQQRGDDLRRLEIDRRRATFQ